MIRIFQLLMIVAALVLAPYASRADSPLLTLTGTGPNGAVSVGYDLAALDALPQQTITTTTPWYEGARDFSGPSLKALIDNAGLAGQSLRVAALNDYAVTLPYVDLIQFNVVLASRIDGKLLSVRDKGPLFVIYPFDSDKELQQETYYARSVWQVAKISIE